MIKKKILIFSRFFLPGYKAGGPIKSLKTFIERHQINKTFLILSSDRDYKSDVYKNITFNKLLKRKNYKIIYLTKDKQNILSYYKIIKNFNPSIIILNSFFDYYFSIKVNLLNKFFLLKKIILFSRGELLIDALSIKKIKKKIFIFFAKKFNLYDQVKFLCSSISEKKNIQSIFNKSRVKYFPILLETVKKINLNKVDYNKKILKILYISRIVPNKNLLFCLEILKKINFNYALNIVGPIEDFSYWKKCENFIKQNEIKANYLGSIKNNKIAKLFLTSHCLFFPSKFESFGHVIYEALCNGLPVVISTNTPWTNHNKSKIIFSANLNNPKLFIKHLEYLYNCNNKKYKNIRSECYQLSKDLHRENVKIKLF
jgi:hypothetical protein